MDILTTAAGTPLVAALIAPPARDQTARQKSPATPPGAAAPAVATATAAPAASAGVAESAAVLDPKLEQYLALLAMFGGKENVERTRSMIAGFSRTIIDAGKNAAPGGQPAAAGNPAEAAAKLSAPANGTAATVVSTALDVRGRVATAATPELAGDDVAGRILSGSISFSQGLEISSRDVQQCDPLVLDIAGDGLNLRGAAAGVEFDLRGDGRKVQSGFVRGDDALLFLDRNGNGVVDDGKELFGDQEGDAHGFAKLAKFDQNGDGVIDEKDEVYGRLRLWQDLNGDGVCQEYEVKGLAAHEVREISLAYRQVRIDDAQGNTVAQAGTFTRADGSAGLAADVNLGYLA